MKTHPVPVIPGELPLRLFAAMLALGLLPIPLPAAGGAAPVLKPYMLYMGANLSVEKDGKVWPVQGVQRNSFVIDVDGRRVVVRDSELRMKIDNALKLTKGGATIIKLTAERAYTSANDPRHHAREAMMLAGEASDSVDQSVATLNDMQGVDGREQQTIAHWDPRAGPPPAPTYSAADLANAAGAVQQSVLAQGSTMNSVPDAIAKEQEELDRQLFDAFRLSFQISSPTPLTDPYLVVVVRFRESPDDAKTTRLLIYAQVLPTINDKPETVRLFRGGFPRGYQLEDYQIHLYEHGTEVATNAAPKHMAMTGDEAFQYSLIDYEIRNREQTKPPAPAKAYWPADLADRLPEAKLDRTVYVKVGRDGRVAGFYENAACSRPVSDAALEAVRSDLHFYPALAKGKAVESVVAFNLGQRVE